MKRFHLIAASFFIFLLFAQVEAKVRILTFHYNKPDFLEFQIKTFQKFVKDDYELIVFNDAPSAEMERSIQSVCNKYDVDCIRYQQDWHFSNPINKILLDKFSKVRTRFSPDHDMGKDPSVRHSHVIQFAMENFGYNHDDLVIILDGDMFPIRALNIKELQNNYDVMGLVLKDHKSSGDNFAMFWVPFISLNMPQLPDQHSITFNLDVIDGRERDTGASFNHYLDEHLGLSLKKYPSWDESKNFRSKSIKELLTLGFSLSEVRLCKALAPEHSVQFHLGHHLLHFGSSSFKLHNYQQKSDCVTRFLNEILR